MTPTCDRPVRPARFPALRACPAAFLLALVLGAALAAGCVKMDRPQPEKRYYSLEAGPGQAGALLPGQSPEAAVTVRRMRVSPRYEGRELVYRLSPTQYVSDFYNLFFIAPADMLTQGVRERIAGSGLFSHVVEPVSLVRSRLVLEGAVSEMYGDFSKAAPEAVLRVQFFLLDEAPGGPTILFSREYARIRPLADKTATGLVDGLNAALASVLDELARDLAANRAGK